MIYHVENEESFVKDEVFKEEEFFEEISETEMDNISKHSAALLRVKTISLGWKSKQSK